MLSYFSDFIPRLAVTAEQTLYGSHKKYKGIRYSTYSTITEQLIFENQQAHVVMEFKILVDSQ